MNEEKYPVLYYDITQANDEFLERLANQLDNYFRRDNVPFIVLPNVVNLKFLTKKEVLERLEEIKKEVETWE